jgi:hypothetical protein
MGGVTTWSLASALALGSLGLVLSGELGERTLLLPGASTDGHYQMELRCSECHGGPFAGESALESACSRCHGQELEAAQNSHPKSKFTDPRNADRLLHLDARRCVTCHREHWPEGTREMGVSVQEDNCSVCHADIGRERPSHVALSWSSCASGGCHRYHDNRSTIEELLVQHADDDAFGSARGPGANERVTSPPARATTSAAPAGTPRSGAPRPLTAADADAPSGLRLGDEELAAWARSAHAQSGVNCRGCHELGLADPSAPARSGLGEQVQTTVCGRCHADERAGWLSGKHGLREGLGLPPMQTELARKPMHESASGQPLSCMSCHGAHGFEPQLAAVEACQGCHADRHTEAYSASPHARLWRSELLGTAPPGSGVSCATCHLPRVEHPSGRELVQHNQNDNLAPREKMIQNVCLDCHGLGFSIDALADDALVERNFTGTPRAHVPSIEWAVARARSKQAGQSQPGAPHSSPGEKHDPPPPLR